LDLDGFKPVNDSFGHGIGDELLIEVARRIKANLRECDTVCRIGGDEFAILLQDLQSTQQCEDTLKRIHAALANPFSLSLHPIWIGASSGVTLYPLDNVPPYSLLRHADQAMYQAKHAGRNCYRIYLDLIAQGVLPPDNEALIEAE
jgi:diguanylate cyclase (GGDEF)-like protein